MDFSNFLKILYPYCSNGEKEADFVITVINNIISDEERNPLSLLTLDYLKRIFNGTRTLNKKSATIILGNLNKLRFDEYLNKLTDDALQSICDELNKYGYDADFNNISLYYADILESILKSIVYGDVTSKKNKFNSQHKVEEKKSTIIKDEELEKLSEEEKKMVDEFSKQIDLKNNNVVLLYGASAEKKIADFSNALFKSIRSKDI